eukprot:403359236
MDQSLDRDNFYDNYETTNVRGRVATNNNNISTTLQAPPTIDRDQQQPKQTKQEDFKFIFEDREVDEKFLHKFEVISILKGNLDPLTQYVDEIAYKSLDYKMKDHPDPTIGKLLKIQQLGIQYLLFLQELQKKKAQVNQQFSFYEKENIEKLKTFKQKQEAKLKELERKNDHAEYMINIYEEKLKKIRLSKKSNMGASNNLTGNNRNKNEISNAIGSQYESGF